MIHLHFFLAFDFRLTARACLAAFFQPAADGIGAWGNLARMLALYRGVIPVITQIQDLNTLERMLIERGLIAPGAVIVFISVNPDMSRPDANYVNVQKVG